MPTSSTIASRPARLENQQRGERVELEERQRVVAARRVDALERGDQRASETSRPSIDDALVVAKQMRRSERADAIAGLAQNALQQRDAGALAVRAADGDDRACGRRQSEPLERALQAVEAEIDRVRMQRLLPREPVGKTCETHGRAARSRRTTPTRCQASSAGGAACA